MVEFALVLPVALLVVLGLTEVGYALLDNHVVTRVAREGSNLISRDTTIEHAVEAMKTMSTRPINFDDGSKVIFSVIKRGATTGTANYDKLILYQRHEYGALDATSMVKTRGAGSFRGGPNFEANNSDTDISLQVTSVAPDLVTVKGGLVYVTEVYTRHDPITPLHNFGITLPKTLYSIAYF
jgi:hypothetical protein